MVFIMILGVFGFFKTIFNILKIIQLDALKIKSVEKEGCFELQISHTFEVGEKVEYSVTVWCLIG